MLPVKQARTITLIANTMATTGGYRQSCDPCYSSKLKCDREKPECTRCRKNGSNCVYGEGKRPGRRRKNPLPADSRPNTAGSLMTPMASSSSGHASECLSSAGAGSSLTMASSLPHLSHTQPFGDMSYDGWMESGASDFSEFLQTPATLTMPWIDDLMGESPVVVDMPQMQAATATIHQDGVYYPQPPPSWPADSKHFWEDCDSLALWGSSFITVMALDAAEQSDPSRKQCQCFKGHIGLQFHANQYSLSAPVPVDATLFLQRLLLWVFEQHQQCHACRDGDMIILVLANIASRVTESYRTILEDDYSRKRGSMQSLSGKQPERRADSEDSVKLGTISVGQHGGTAFLYSK